MGLFKRWRAKRAAKKQLKAEQKAKKVETVEKKEEKQVETVKPKTTTKTPVKKVEPKPKPVKEEEDHEDAFRYHVSQNKDKKSAYYKQWRVRRSGSRKTIKYFDTQKEAIDYAEDLAEKANTSVVIHKLDGSIRKQNY